MKVYELMKELSAMPAGADVKIDMIKELSELPPWDGDNKERCINFLVMSAELQEGGKSVSLDGWTI